MTGGGVCCLHPLEWRFWDFWERTESRVHLHLIYGCYSSSLFYLSVANKVCLAYVAKFFFFFSFLCCLSLWCFSIPWQRRPVLNWNFWTFEEVTNTLSKALYALLEISISFRSLRVPVAVVPLCHTLLWAPCAWSKAGINGLHLARGGSWT